MVLTQPEDLDVVGLAEDDLEAAFQVFFVRGGRVLGRRGWVVDRVEDLNRAELVASFVRQLYMERTEVPPRVLVPALPADREVLETWLATRRSSKVTDRACPERGAKRKLLEVVNQQRGGGVPSPQAAARVGLRGAVPRALGAGRAARPAAGAAADRVLRHLEPRADRHGRLDGGVRGRAAQALATTGSSRSRASPGQDDFAIMEEMLRRRFARLVRRAASGRSRPAAGASRTRRRSSWSTAAGAARRRPRKVLADLGSGRSRTSAWRSGWRRSTSPTGPSR